MAQVSLASRQRRPQSWLSGRSLWGKPGPGQSPGSRASSPLHLPCASVEQGCRPGPVQRGAVGSVVAVHRQRQAPWCPRAPRTLQSPPLSAPSCPPAPPECSTAGLQRPAGPLSARSASCRWEELHKAGEADGTGKWPCSSCPQTVWTGLDFGHPPDGDSLHPATGTDSSCRGPGPLPGLLWVMWERGAWGIHGGAVPGPALSGEPVGPPD